MEDRFSMKQQVEAFFETYSLTAGFFNCIPSVGQNLDQSISLISLNFDDPVLYGASDAALRLQFAGNLFERVFATWESRYDGYATSPSALSFATNSYHSVIGIKRHCIAGLKRNQPKISSSSDRKINHGHFVFP